MGVRSINSITSLPTILYSMPNFQQNITGHVKSKKNQLELYFQKGSLGSSMDPFPSDTSVTSGENCKINNLLKSLKVVLRAYRI